MPNWCYNSTSLELDDSEYQRIKELVFNINVKGNKIPECLVKNVMNYLYDYTESENYLEEMEQKIEEELLSSGDSLASYDTRWSSASDVLKELSEDMPFVKIINEYEITQDDIGGVDIIFEGEYLSETTWKISEKNWEEFGDESLEEVKNILLNYEFQLENKKIKFDTIENLKEYCMKDEDNLENLFELIDLDEYMMDNDLCDCEEYFKEGIKNILNI